MLPLHIDTLDREGDVVQHAEARGRVDYLALGEGVGTGWLGKLLFFEAGVMFW